MGKEIAIIMAAGMGTRMRPLTEKIAKPLVKVLGKPMIETVIDCMKARGVENIYVVTGYKSEQFLYLKDKYENIILLENTEYSKKNNLSSLYCACDFMQGHDCFICEADLFISNTALFKKSFVKSGYFGKMKKGYSDDWVFEQDESGRITRVGKCGKDCYNMAGVSFFLKKDADILSKKIKESYQRKDSDDMFWDEVVDANLNILDLCVYPIDENDIVEIDTVEELKNMEDFSYE